MARVADTEPELDHAHAGAGDAALRDDASPATARLASGDTGIARSTHSGDTARVGSRATISGDEENF